ncbi:MAG TPA: hypothetical protein VE954_12915 [Oligoflexus sp.]|uniref:hypothetical protein n=1 Tax=Oligoflexus sp. TaxID=1971216 RepID=UPI002D270C27|nr:hypothetical protein [Oligoflexus sp.]HYX34010.1 hypothetical protein [Oligoflexus sp.]
MRQALQVWLIAGSRLILNACNKALLMCGTDDISQAVSETPGTNARRDRPTEAGESLPGYLRLLMLSKNTMNLQRQKQHRRLDGTPLAVRLHSGSIARSDFANSNLPQADFTQANTAGAILTQTGKALMLLMSCARRCQPTDRGCLSPADIVKNIKHL